MTEQIENKKSKYLEDFKRENDLSGLGWNNVESVGEKLVDCLKKEELTYEEAYASLQFAYNRLKFESNFFKLN